MNIKHLMAFLLLMMAAFSCKNTSTPPVNPPTGPVVEETPDSLRFCKTIAPIPHPVSTKRRALGYIDKWWPQNKVLKVGFPWGGTAAQKDMVKAGFDHWKAAPVNLTFSYPTTGPWDIRVAFNPNDGSWSYIGVDCATIPANEPTMNIGWVEQAANDHECGHAIGLLHEHQNPSEPICFNQENVIQDLSGPPNNWDLATIKYNVLNPVSASETISTAHDPLSIMHYTIPARWTCNNVAIPGGKLLSLEDKGFIAKRYPAPVAPPVSGTVTISKSDRDNIIRLETKARTYADSARIASKKAFGL